MSELDVILKQNANLTLGIINLIELLDSNIKYIKKEDRDTYLFIRTYKQIKEYLEEVLEVSYGKRKQ